MISPTGRAIILACLGAPLSLLLASTVASNLWPVGAAWALGICALVSIDGLLATPPGRMRVSIAAPAIAPIGVGAIEARLQFECSTGSGPPNADMAIETNHVLRRPLAPQRIHFGEGRSEAVTSIIPLRRGEGRIERVHCRWMGPLGLAWRQLIAPLQTRIAVTPDLDAVEREAKLLFSRTMTHGIKPLRDRGDGSEFDALTEFEPGMDHRLLEWKQSAKHLRLLAKEVRAERNHQLVFAIDTGCAMCEPVAGAARVDWSINAALMLAYVALKLGDRVSFFGFDARPHLMTGFASGMRAFRHLQAQTAQLDYSTNESNYTLGLTTLAERLQRRSMVIVFTDFSDTVNAELMVENITRLARRHLIVFVTFSDEELESLRDAEPRVSGDVARAVIAQRLLQERGIVLERLRRLGVHIVDAPVRQLGQALVRAYDMLRRRERV
ncbi:MAG: DUF58 domain-containing protein [Proteobacteria bacterium]|nr:DUF58 domain-containing protein [Pseudomonadota bacterium]